MPPIVGLVKDLIDPGTDAATQFHAVVAYAVQLRTEASSVTLASWVSRAAFEAGKKPLAHIAVSIKARPAGDCADVDQWFYARIVELGEATHLVGAEVAYAAVLPAEESAA